MDDSYSTLERRFLIPARKLLLIIYSPLVRLLAARRVPPNAVSFSQVIVGALVVVLTPMQPRVAFILFVAALALDGVDGALARATNRATKFGALFDQYCDHIREVTVVAGLALYLCNTYRAPLPLVIKSYLVVYPALFAYLWFGANLLDAAVALSLALMWLVIALGLWRLGRAMNMPE